LARCAQLEPIVGQSHALGQISIGRCVGQVVAHVDEPGPVGTDLIRDAHSLIERQVRRVVADTQRIEHQRRRPVSLGQVSGGIALTSVQ